ncbi:hypothetical protein M8818_007035 [Zalaria obscura]|uniref:Uncharacterized protein n=1 Tax=Zalaria obscura TaxID=2024903 RepID=A0ACC3S5R1_9PEZI
MRQSPFPVFEHRIEIGQAISKIKLRSQLHGVSSTAAHHDSGEPGSHPRAGLFLACTRPPGALRRATSICRTTPMVKGTWQPIQVTGRQWGGMGVQLVDKGELERSRLVIGDGVG